MSPEAQRIAIAEACKLKPPFTYERKGKWIAQKVIWTVPDYLSDLNAMHEAEKVLQQIQHDYSHGFANEWQYGCWTRYITTLKNLTKSARTFLGGEIHATAAQRAEAFLRTIGKWVDA